MLFYGLRRWYWSELSLGALLGLACFLLQFKRSAMCVLNRVWVLCDSRLHRSCFEMYNNELLLLFALTPLLQIDARQGLSDTVTASDASEQGAGVTASRSLSAEGVSALLRRSSPSVGLMEGEIILVESFAGLASTRVAFAMLGLRPALHIVAECDPFAQRVIRHWWPDAVVFNTVEEVTVGALLGYASGATGCTTVLHTAGSPCPGFCKWNPSH